MIETPQVTPLAYRPRMVAVGGIGISGGHAQQDHDLCETAFKQLGVGLR